MDFQIVDSISLKSMLLILFMAIVLLRKMLGRSMKHNYHPFASRTKHPGLDIFSYRAYFFEVGLSIALAIIYLLMQWTVPYDQTARLYESEDLDLALDIDIIRTAEAKDPLRLKKVARPADEYIIEMVDEKNEPTPIDELIMTEELSEVDSTITWRDLPAAPPLPADDTLMVDLPLMRAEQMPRFPGCEDLNTEHDKSSCAEQALLQFLYKNIRYPVLARENGVEGTCVISFVVEKNGTIGNLQIMRDIGAGCGAESLRVVTLMNTLEQRWTPGKQGGRPVRVQFNLPVKFKLQ